MMGTNDNVKRQFLMAAIRKAGHEIGKSYYESNTEDYDIDDDETGVDERPRLKDGRIDPLWLNEGFEDVVGESLYGSDSQAEDIKIDTLLFADEIKTMSTWDILDKYINDNHKIEELFCKGWHDFLHETYGDLWPTDE